MAEALILRWQGDKKEGGKGWKLSPQENAQFTTDHLGVPPRSVPILTFRDQGWILGIPKGVDGEIGIGKEIIPFSRLKTEGKLKSEAGYDALPLPQGFLRVTLKFPQGELLIHPESQKPIGASPPKAPSEEPPLLRRIQTERQKRDRWFTFILLFFFMMHALLILFLATHKVPEIKPLEVTQIPERYAEIIVPPKPPEPQKATKVETKPAPGPEEGGGGGEPPPGEGKEKDKPAGPKSKEEILQKVRTKGVLAVLTAKGKGGALSNLLEGAGVQGLGQALEGVGGVMVGGVGDVRKGRGGGGGGGGVGIGALAAGEGRELGLGGKGQRRVEAAIETGDIATQGSLSQEAIQAVVQKRIASIKACYDNELAKNPKLQGKIVIQFTIGEDGSVVDASVKSSTMGSKEVEECVVRRFLRFTFPKPERGTVTVEYPLVFSLGA